MKSFGQGRTLVAMGAAWLCAVALPAGAAPTEKSPDDEAREQALLAAAVSGSGGPFQVKQTPHFLIAFDAERSLVDELTARLEQTYASVLRFCEVSGFTLKPPQEPLEVIFFNTWEGYARYSVGMSFPPQGTYGFYHEESNRSAFFNVTNDPQLLQFHANIVAARRSLDDLTETMKTLKDNRMVVEIRFQDGRRARLNRAQVKEEVESARKELKTLDGQRAGYCDHINRTVIQHEVAHQVLFNTGIHVRGADNPKWLVEGLACLFETPPDARGTGIAAINQLRLRDFRTAVTGGDAANRAASSGDYLGAVSTGRMIPLDRLIADPRLFQERGERGATVYAATWALAHYLHRTRNKELAAYLQAVSTRQPGRKVAPAKELALFQEHFGPIDETFSRRFSDYVLRLPVRATVGGP